MPADRPTAEVLARSAAILFERIRDLERYDPAGAARLKATIAEEARRWWQENNVPMGVQHGQ